MILTPAVTFKVKKCLDRVPTVKELSMAQMNELVQEIRTGIIQILKSYDLAPKLTKKIGPEIETSAMKALRGL